MRVKKLSANRRQKPGEDERWVSPSKPSAASSSSGSSSAAGVESGASSPSDPYSVHPVALPDLAAAASPPRFQLEPAAFMAKNMSPQLLVPQDARAGVNFDKSPADWRARVDTAVREAVHAKIVELLRALKPHAPDKVLERVPGLAYRIEESLFRSAQSEPEYRDPSSLPQRLALVQESNAKRLLQQQSSAAAAPPRPASGPRPVLSEEQARVVFQCLQTWRQKLVNMYGVAPWEILPNQALAKVAVCMPSSEQELAACGVDDALVARFGSSLLQEMQQIYQAVSNASVKYASGSAKPSGRKAEGSKRPATDAAAASNKRRKASSSGEPAFPSAAAASARLAPAPSHSFASSASSATSTPLLASAQLFRPAGIDSLPTLLPSASVASAASAASKKAFGGASAGRLSPQGQVLHPPLFSRIESERQEQSHMHLLAQGAGQVSKQQQESASAEAYEKEIQTLRWMLHQSQQEKAQLEAEVQHLRQQLHGP